MKRLHLEIYGRVQGVAFRAHTHREARTLGLEGWIRNRSDGSVEVLAEGEEAQLESLREYCSRGPRTAEVSKVEEQWLDFVGDLKPFSIRYV